MPVAGNAFTVTLENSHLNWGTHRYTHTRDHIYGEGYIKVPKSYARSYNIYNSNYTTDPTMGVNLFNCSSSDGLYNGVVLAAGSSEAGDIYAKQLQGFGDLQAIGGWYAHIGARVGDSVRVEWTSPTSIIITHIPQ